MTTDDTQRAGNPYPNTSDLSVPVDTARSAPCASGVTSDTTWGITRRRARERWRIGRDYKRCFNSIDFEGVKTHINREPLKKLLLLCALLFIGCKGATEEVMFNEPYDRYTWRRIGTASSDLGVYVLKIDGVEYIIAANRGVAIVRHTPKH